MAFTKITIDGTDYELVAIPNEPKQVSKDYVILKCENNSMGIHDFVSAGQAGTSTDCLATNCKIHSVKRLSDNEVFTIGEEVGCKVSPDIFTIKEIELSGEPYLINHELRHYMPLRNAIKIVPQPKKPLFTTTDGKDIYEGDDFWFVFPQWSVGKQENCLGEMRGQLGTFKTEEAANEYVLINKPLLSFQDVYDYVTNPTILHELKELAKSKI